MTDTGDEQGVEVSNDVACGETFLSGDVDCGESWLVAETGDNTKLLRCH